MDNRQLDKLLTASAVRQARLIDDSLPPKEEINKIVPSQKFEQNMREILAEGAKEQKRRQSRKRLGKIVASIILVFAVTFGVVMSASASRSSLVQFFERYFTIGSNSNSWDAEFNAQVSKNVHDCYLPSWLPGGLQAIESSQSNQKCTIVYKGSNQTLKIMQSESSIKIFSDNEISEMEVINSNNAVFYYTEKQRSSYIQRYLIWQTNDYNFRLESTLPKEDLLKIAENMVYKKG